MSIDLEHGKDIRIYRVVSIEKIDTPEGMEKGSWYRYVISRNGSIINGMQSGTLSAVKQHAEEFVEGLNERTMKGRSAYSATRKK